MTTSRLAPSVAFVIAALVSACGDSGARGNWTPEQRAAYKAKNPGSQSGQPTASAGATQPPAEDSAAKQPTAPAAPADSGVPFTRFSGYVVRGTDESSFRTCGSKQTHYIRARGEAAFNLTQRYRFQAGVPLSPVYFVFMGRIVADTVVVGDHTYTSVIEVRRVVNLKENERPDCPGPMRGSMIAQ